MTLFDYITGDRRGTEAHRLEKAAMNDPFLADALEGFDAVEGDHVRTIERLHCQMKQRTGGRRRSLAARWSAAAALLLIVVTVGGLLLRPNRETVVETVLPPVLAQIAEPEAADRPAAEDSAAAESPMEIAQALEKERIVRPLDQPVLVPEVEKMEMSEFDISAEEELDFVPVPPSVATRSMGFLPDSAAMPPAYTKTDIRLQAERAAAEGWEGGDSLSETIVTGFGEEPRRNEETGVAAAVPTVESGRPVGGMEAYRNYIHTHMIPPRDAEGRAVKGRVLLDFRVNRAGRPTGIRVIERLAPEADREARRLLESGPDWNRADSRVRIVIEF